MIPQVDFDIVDSILKVLEGRELGNKGLYEKYWPYKNITKNSRFYFGSGVQKTDVYDFFEIFYNKKSGIRESRVRRRFETFTFNRIGPSTVATVLLLQYCCNSTVATILLQQCCCNIATVLLQQYH